MVGNRTWYAQGAWGVWFGPRSPLNYYGFLPQRAPQTSSCAGICALTEALHIIKKELLPDLPLSQIFIPSDSSYLVRVFSERMRIWLDNGGYNTRGQPVAHWETLRDIQHLIDELLTEWMAGWISSSGMCLERWTGTLNRAFSGCWGKHHRRNKSQLPL